MIRLFITSPAIDIIKNIKNLSISKLSLFSLNVQKLLSMKFDVAAQLKPIAFEIYLFMRSFSLHKYVKEKSIAIPEQPTIPNLIIFKTPGRFILLIDCIRYGIYKTGWVTVKNIFTSYRLLQKKRRRVAFLRNCQRLNKRPVSTGRLHFNFNPYAIS